MARPLTPEQERVVAAALALRDRSRRKGGRQGLLLAVLLVVASAAGLASAVSDRSTLTGLACLLSLGADAVAVRGLCRAAREDGGNRDMLLGLGGLALSIALLVAAVQR